MDGMRVAQAARATTRGTGEDHPVEVPRATQHEARTAGRPRQRADLLELDRSPINLLLLPQSHAFLGGHRAVNALRGGGVGAARPFVVRSRGVTRGGGAHLEGHRGGRSG